MNLFLGIGSIGVVIAVVITVFVWRAKKKTRRDEIFRQHAKEQTLAELDQRHRAEEEARAIAEQDARRRVEEELRRKAEMARIAAQAEAQRRIIEESRLKAEAETHQRAEQQARLAVAEQAQREAEEKACVTAAEVRRRAEEARVAEEAKHIAEEESRRDTESNARIAVEVQVRREVEERARPNALPTGQVATTIVVEETATTALDTALSPLRAPRQYRPVARAPAASRPAPTVSDSNEQDTRDRALPIDVRLVFEKAGFCRISLLPHRAQGMPDELTISGSGNPPELIALQEYWYQDVVSPSAGHLLRHGVEWVGALSEGQHARWSLSGRDIYVLARHDELNGYVNIPRLILGEEQVVLCTAERLANVRSAIALTRSPEPVILSNDSGLPEGWVGIRGVVPQVPITPSAEGDILDALRPLAEVKIVLESGIRIERQTWLSGFPPRIRLRGNASAISRVVIDNRDAALNHEGDYVVPSWDALGNHNVWCASGSRTYAIREGAENWEPWDAYTWSLGETVAGSINEHPVICGVLARPPRLSRSDSRATVVPATNPVLIGAVPGEIVLCSIRGDLRVGQCIGFPWFKPVWAIPADALHSDKRSARVLMVGPPQSATTYKQQPIAHSSERRRRTHIQGVYTWCAAIRMAGKKGLQIEPQQRDFVDLWKVYNERAKAIWRSMR